MQPLDVYLENVIKSDFNNNHDLVMDNFDRLKTLGDKGSQIEAAGLIQRNCPASRRDGRKRKRPSQDFWKSCINCGETRTRCSILSCMCWYVNQKYLWTQRQMTANTNMHSNSLITIRLCI